MAQAKADRQKRLAKRIAADPAAATAVAAYKEEKARRDRERKAGIRRPGMPPEFASVLPDAKRLYAMEGPRLNAILVGRAAEYDPDDVPLSPPVRSSKAMATAFGAGNAGKSKRTPSKSKRAKSTSKVKIEI